MPRKLYVLFIVRNHFINDSRVLKEARSLAKNGYRVTIRCLWDHDLPRHEVYEGLTVERLTYSRRTGQSMRDKVKVYISFFRDVLQNSRKFSIVHCHDLDALPIGVLIKAFRFSKTKIVYDAHEYETQKHGQGETMRALLGILERCMIAFADAVICVSESIANEYVRLYKIRKPYLILNCPAYQEVTGSSLLREKLGIAKGSILFLYQGGLSKGRGIELIAEAFCNMDDPGKVVVFMGYGPLESFIADLAKKHGNIFFLPAVPPDELLKYTASADVGMLYYEDTCLNHYYCSPNKLFEYTMARLPIIVSNLHELSRFVSTHGNGMVAENSVSSLLSVIKDLSTDEIMRMKEKAQQLPYVYNWEAQERILLDLYQGLEA